MGMAGGVAKASWPTSGPLLHPRSIVDPGFDGTGLLGDRRWDLTMDANPWAVVFW